MYWMSRYLERTEHTARLMDLTLNQALDQSPEVAKHRWHLLLASLRSPIPETLEAYPVTEFLTFDTNNKDSLVSCITAARENARQIREQISSEMWEQLNHLYLSVRGSDIKSIYAQPHGFYGPIKEGSHLIQGITDSTLMRNEGWQFIQLGRYIERASATATLLDVHLRSLMNTPEQSARGQDYISWVALLKSCTSFESYCQTYTADLRPERIAEFLLLNSELPRSVRFAVDSVQASLETLSKLSGARKSGRSQRLAGKLRATLDYAQLDEIIDDDIHTFLQNIHRQCSLIHTAVHQQYIAYSIDAAIAY